MGGKLLNGIKNMYINNLPRVKVEWGESEWFGIDNGVRQKCINTPWLFNVYMEAVKMRIGRKEMRFQEEGREWRLLGLLYADDLVLCGESEEDLRAMVGHFVKECRRRGLKVNKGKSNLMALNGKDGL